MQIILLCVCQSRLLGWLFLKLTFELYCALWIHKEQINCFCESNLNVSSERFSGRIADQYFCSDNTETTFWNSYMEWLHKMQGNDKYFESVIYSLCHWFKISITLPLTSADILSRYQKEKKTKTNPVQFAVKYIKAKLIKHYYKRCFNHSQIRLNCFYVHLTFRRTGLNFIPKLKVLISIWWWWGGIFFFFNLHQFPQQANTIQQT